MLNKTVVLALHLTGLAAAKDVMLMNRIGPSKSELYVANPDGSGERKLIAGPGFDYHANYSADGKWIVFTSERAGDGQADIYRVRADGTTPNSGFPSFSADGKSIVYRTYGRPQEYQ